MDANEEKMVEITNEKNFEECILIYIEKIINHLTINKNINKTTNFYIEDKSLVEIPIVILLGGSAYKIFKLFFIF